MNDYITIISNIATLVIGGGGILFYESKRRKEVAGARAAEFENLKKELECNRELADQHRQDLILYSEDNKKIRETKNRLKSELAQEKYKTAKLTRQYEGAKKALISANGRLDIAEAQICFKTCCEIREPDAGEYKTHRDVLE